MVAELFIAMPRSLAQCTERQCLMWQALQTWPEFNAIEQRCWLISQALQTLLTELKCSRHIHLVSAALACHSGQKPRTCEALALHGVHMQQHQTAFGDKADQHTMLGCGRACPCKASLDVAIVFQCYHGVHGP